MSQPFPPLADFRITNPFARAGGYASVRDAHGAAGHHTGTDYASPVPGQDMTGAPVRSCTNGVVVISDFNATMGNWVGVYCAQHDVLLTYWHLSRRDVRVGQTVLQGTVLGAVGSTGNSTAAHLHLQANRGRAFNYHGHINPAPWAATVPRGKSVPTYLEQHPPRTTQFRPRRSTPSGLIVVHTAESAPDVLGPDGGAEGVARFIQGRSDYGSYHVVADSDSRVHLVPFGMAAYGDGTGSNEFAIHVSAATQAARWPSLSDDYADDMVQQMAKGAADAARWLKANGYPVPPARRVTRAESDRRMAGFISHAERDPSRRSDPGSAFPWDVFLDAYTAEMEGTEYMSPQQEKRIHDHLDALAEADGPLVKRVADRVLNGALVEMPPDDKGKPRKNWSLARLVAGTFTRSGGGS